MARTRKSKEKATVAEQMKKQLDRVQAEFEQELEAEKRLLLETEEKIKKVAEDESLFCGIILTVDDILQIIKLAIEQKENIKIPFKLYFLE